ncbi:4089_t:CDS:2 [Cetraspora pellucida]|uniref:4089_t:CDS:1 n=1 Tax=Cetraspora pellucida TaxID=1433469 RepID=A0A9N9JU59_9GLOM|nr:4089_t:CDS:2 [Cetraspora pellucida]
MIEGVSRLEKASNPKTPNYENIRFSYISPEQIPSVKSFSSERSTVIIFEDKYHHVPIIIHENIFLLVTYNGGSSYQDVSKIASRYIDNVKGAFIVINSYLYKGEFVVFDLSRLENDMLTIRLRFDTPLNLQKEIEVRQKRKEKSASLNK